MVTLPFVQDPLHYPHGTKFLAPGPLGQCHPIPGAPADTPTPLCLLQCSAWHVGCPCTHFSSMQLAPSQKLLPIGGHATPLLSFVSGHPTAFISHAPLPQTTSR